jgi:hypothetical protein
LPGRWRPGIIRAAPTSPSKASETSSPNPTRVEPERHPTRSGHGKASGDEHGEIINGPRPSHRSLPMPCIPAATRMAAALSAEPRAAIEQARVAPIDHLRLPAALALPSTGSGKDTAIILYQRCTNLSSINSRALSIDLLMIALSLSAFRRRGYGFFLMELHGLAVPSACAAQSEFLVIAFTDTVVAPTNSSRTAGPCPAVGDGVRLGRCDRCCSYSVM